MEEILDHYKHPHNKGTVPNPGLHLFDSNPLCGDEQEVFIQLDYNQNNNNNNNNYNKTAIKELKFTGKGCAISIAATSMLTDELKGKNIEEVLRLPNEFVLDLLGVKVSAMRMKCALLGLKTIQKAIIQYLGGKEYE